MRFAMRQIGRQMGRLLLCLVVPLLLAACGAQSVWAPDAEVNKAIYRSGNPPSVTLITVIEANTGEGGHSALMIDGSQRVIFDPAGSWYYPGVPERNDVDYGITDRMHRFYVEYHARDVWFVREQKLPVTLAQADALIAAAEANGPSPKMFCARSVSGVLHQVPGFESLPRTFFPVSLSDAFGRLPGVVSQDHYTTDADIKTGIPTIDATKPKTVEIHESDR